MHKQYFFKYIIPKIKFRFLDIRYESTNSTPEEFHIFVVFFAITGIRTYLPTYLVLIFGN